MTDVSAQPTTTPSRRRRPRGNGKAAAHKNYASENDAAALDAPNFYSPQTPHRVDAASSPAHAQPHSAHTGSHSKPRNRNRAANMNNNANQRNSPEDVRSGRHTPPTTQRSTSSKSAGAAFAGATFHASPAPSALPIPSFLAKAASDSPISKKSRELTQEPSPPATDTDAPTPFRTSSASRANESPLDFMFRAHREERERQRRESSTGQRPANSDFTSPSSMSPFEHNSPPKPFSLSEKLHQQARQPSGRFDAAELDGTPGQALGPAFSTPYSERIKAARTNSSRSAINGTPPRPSQALPQEDPTEALKKFLFSGNGMAGSPGAKPANNATPPASAGFVEIGPSSPTARYDAAPHQRPTNIQAMENDLRRILKLDLTADAGSTNHRFY
ncbi:hypothetical protein B0I35DRAFT_106864 [Stachybotrys elegans]|uniref:Proteophosphoglycan 5 n=1 Tax=Stachybotrys elegans TaxID=80388 RepID=A0A8K0SFY0_9HYPO|nr:hypothetical protein B0I35DRAFT_106864 [Stachybotrys elegans]